MLLLSSVAQGFLTSKAGDDLIAAKSSCRVGASELHVQLEFAADPVVCRVPTQVITYVW